MKKLIIFIILCLIVWSVYGASTVTYTATKLKRGQESVSIGGRVKTATITEARPVDVNGTPTDANKYSNSTSFTDLEDRDLVINGFLLKVFMDANGTDANGIDVQITTRTHGLVLFDRSGMVDGEFFPFEFSSQNSNVYGSIPVNDIIDVNWSSNDYNNMTIGIDWSSEKE